MALRKRTQGRLTIEQTRDPDLVRAMLAAGGMPSDGVEWPPACYLVAYFGDEPVGVVGLEPKLDAALVSALYVTERMRRRGVGAELIAAVRRAARARGVNSLYMVSGGDYLSRFGFCRAKPARVLDAVTGVPGVEHYRALRHEHACENAWYLDISHDGAVAR